MNLSIKNKIINLYERGNSINKIEKLIDSVCKREAIRKVIKNSGIALRGISRTYKPFASLDINEKILFSELIGYFYGDGSLCKESKQSKESYQCTLTFSLNESELADRSSYITKKLFNFTPKAYKRNGAYSLKFLRTFAYYLANTGYPCGKKSLINPRLPRHIKESAQLKAAFIRGFLNAEASTNKTLSVQQSVRINLSPKVISYLKNASKKKLLNNKICYFISWSNAKFLITLKEENFSNLLLGVKEMLEDFDIESNLYPVRAYIGRNDQVSVHFELSVPVRYLGEVIKLNLITLKKKLDKIKHIAEVAKRSKAQASEACL